MTSLVINTDLSYKFSLVSVLSTECLDLSDISHLSDKPQLGCSQGVVEQTQVHLQEVVRCLAATGETHKHDVWNVERMNESLSKTK